MANRSVLLIHGWSAADRSMARIGAFLKKNGFRTTPLYLGGYPSLFDDVRVEDVARRLDAVIEGLQQGGALGERFHIVCHSTGALVAREWIAHRFEEGRRAPVDNLLMLAPANHGSPFAKFGRSALARVFKFRGGRRGFQTGAEMLHALEHGSAYQEALDLRDRLSEKGETASPYGRGGVRPYVIVGAQPINIASIVDENAWDGTVRIAAANFDPRGVTIDFREDRLNPAYARWARRGPEDTAFAVLPDRTHLSILDPEGGKKDSPDAATRAVLGDLVLRALNTESAQQYRQTAKAFDDIRKRTRTYARNNEEGARLRETTLRPGDRDPTRFNEHYQVVVSVIDDTPRPIDDYFIWLTSPTAKERLSGVKITDDISPAEAMAHREVIRDIHRNKRDPHRSVFHFDRMRLMARDGYFKSLHAARDHVLMAGVTAVAEGSKVGYFERDARRGSGYIPLRAEGDFDYDQPERFLKRYRTHYIKVIAPRIADDDVFKARRM